MIKIFITCNWTDNGSITAHWATKLDKTIPIELVCDRDEADFFLVINKPWREDCGPSGDDSVFRSATRTVLLRMEPHMKERVSIWGDYWADPPASDFAHVIAFPDSLNFVEWHLTYDYDTLLNTDFAMEKTKGDAVSVIMSDRYFDIGQMRRIEFIKYLQDNYSDKLELHVYGRGDLSKYGITGHRGPLPIYAKDAALVPYKYHINCENSTIVNYITEKFYDPVLTDTLVFYAGATNVMSVYPDGGYVALDLDDFKYNADIIVECIKTDAYAKQRARIHDLKMSILRTKTISTRLYTLLAKTISARLYEFLSTEPGEKVVSADAATS